MLYQLHNACPVPWTAVQERTISREFPGPAARPTAAEYVARTYHQFLWLPESIMPLTRLPPALLFAPAELKHAGDTSSPEPWTTRLHTLLRPLLQTPRAIAEKYRTRVTQLLLEEEPGGAYTFEDDLLCFVLKYDAADGARDDESAAQAGARWRRGVLARHERREIMLQVLVHLLLLTLPLPAAPPATHGSPRKRKRPPAAAAPLTADALGERLEMHMDKLALWQLTAALDAGADLDAQHAPSARGKGKHRDGEEHDWAQAFCADVVEPLFAAALPAQCALLRSKLFAHSPFSDASDSDAPPSRPSTASTASTTSTASASAASGSAYRTAKGPERSLSATLAEERTRARSRSLSTGPARRVLAREVSMSTGFRPKTRPPPPGRARSRAGSSTHTTQTNTQANQANTLTARANRHGTTLVAATPVKPRGARGARTGARDVLPMLLDNPAFLGAQAVEGGADDAEWTIGRAPGLLGDRDAGEEGEEGDPEGGEEEGDAGPAWPATPTRRRGARGSREQIR